jgi:hypothetical protein
MGPSRGLKCQALVSNNHHPGSPASIRRPSVRHSQGDVLLHWLIVCPTRSHSVIRTQMSVPPAPHSVIRPWHPAFKTHGRTSASPTSVNASPSRQICRSPASASARIQAANSPQPACPHRTTYQKMMRSALPYLAASLTASPATPAISRAHAIVNLAFRGREFECRHIYPAQPFDLDAATTALDLPRWRRRFRVSASRIDAQASTYTDIMVVLQWPP